MLSNCATEGTSVGTETVLLNEACACSIFFCGCIGYLNTACWWRDSQSVLS